MHCSQMDNPKLIIFITSTRRHKQIFINTVEKKLKLLLTERKKKCGNFIFCRSLPRSVIWAVEWADHRMSVGAWNSDTVISSSSLLAQRGCFVKYTYHIGSMRSERRENGRSDDCEKDRKKQELCEKTRPAQKCHRKEKGNQFEQHTFPIRRRRERTWSRGGPWERERRRKEAINIHNQSHVCEF